MIKPEQMPTTFQNVVAEQLDIYKRSRSVEQRNTIPDTTVIPIANPIHWFKIPDVVCVFVDMTGSTQFSATQHDRSTAGAYQLFTGTAVRLFAAFESPYVDVRGDGVFGLFNSTQVYRALAAAVTFKTFASTVFAPTIKNDTGLEANAHIGIDQKTVLVRKLGLKRVGDRTDRQNEVWAGKPVNMASKLAAMGGADELLVSDRYFRRINHELVRKSCGCPGNQKVDLWTEIDVSDDSKFDFDKAWKLQSSWCGTHGKDFCTAALQLDNR
jgi:class 3 adenylate cyclase